MQEGIDTFIERPFTGVGAGQFKNYNPPGRQEPWMETHNSLIQVASETGIFGLLIFSFLIFRAGLAAATTRRLLARPARGRRPDPLAAILSDSERESLYAHTVGMSAGLVGWFVCSLFASVAYTWTFYYVLALIVAGRELTRYRLSAGLAMLTEKPIDVPAARTSRRRAVGVA
jgi:O-antigen ligase